MDLFYRKPNIDHDDKAQAKSIHKRLTAVFKRLDVRRESVTDYAAAALIKELSLSEVSSNEFDFLKVLMDKHNALLSEIGRLELILFAFITATYVGINQEINISVFVFKSSDIVLSVSLIILSLLNISYFTQEVERSTLRRVILGLLRQKPELDPSGIKKFLFKRSMNPMQVWTDNLKSQQVSVSWSYILAVAVFMPCAIQLIALVALIPFVIISSAYGLAERGNWSFVYGCILVCSATGILVRFFGLLPFNSMTAKFTENNFRKRFYKNADRYGMVGALSILEDEVDNLQGWSK